MARSEVVNAFADRLAAHWSRVPVIEENSVGSAPRNGSPYLLLQFPFSASDRITFGAPGANVYREEGAARLVLHIQRGRGADDGRLWADELGTLFRGKHFDGVETFAPSSAASDDANENGNYYVLAIAVPYRFDFLG